MRRKTRNARLTAYHQAGITTLRIIAEDEVTVGIAMPQPAFAQALFQSGAEAPGTLDLEVHPGWPMERLAAVGISVNQDQSLPEFLDSVELRVIQDALAGSPNVAEAAKRLGVSQATLYRRLNNTKRRQKRNT